MRHPRRQADGGFTLIELLVVMIIIGILAAIAIPIFLSQREKARDTAVKSDVARVGKEMAAYFVDGTAAMYGHILATGTLTLSTSPTAVGVTGANTFAAVLLSAGTTAPPSGAVITNLALSGNCTVPNSWFVTLHNPGGATKTYYYGPIRGLTPTAPSTCA